MIPLPPGAVLLDPSEVDFIANALELCAELMAECRVRTDNRPLSGPSPQLVAFTAAKLRRAGGSLAVRATGADHGQRAEPPEQSASVRAPQQDSVEFGRHDMGTGEAARYLGITANAARDAARRKRLPARRTGTRWVFDSAAVADYARKRADRGR